ncbi:MAG: hypothetical protein AB8B85_07115 [Paracoccaceae bacterium]
MTLLKHFYEPDEPDEIFDLRMGDWIDVLADLPQAAIEHAVKERLWEDSRTRPTPGEIRARALKHIKPTSKPSNEPPAFGPSGTPVLTLEDAERIRAEVDAERSRVAAKIRVSED